VEDGSTGVVLDRFEPEACSGAIERCHRLDRQAVARAAARQFDSRRIVAVIVESLEKSV
jgi:hypothetical protein